MRIWLSCWALALVGCGAPPDDGTMGIATTPPADEGALSVASGTQLSDGEMLAAARLRWFPSGTLPNPEHAHCLFGTSDAAGDVALGRQTDTDTIWSFYSAAGTPLGTATGNPDPIDGDRLGPQIHPADSGFQIAAQRFGAQTGALLIDFAVDGTRRAENAISGRLDTLVYLSSIPAGGVTSATFSPLARGDLVRWFDDRGDPLADHFISVAVPYDDVRDLVGTDTLSHTLALYPGLRSLRAQWLDTDGTERGGEFTLAVPPDAQLAPLIGGGFAVRSGDRWTGVIASDGTSITAAPAWLRHRPRTRLVIVGYGQLYALLFDDGETKPSLPQWIELRRADGAWAGALVVWPPKRHDASQRTRIGRDGTLVQLFSRTEPDGDACDYRWWPRLLRSGVDSNGAPEGGVGGFSLRP